MPQKRLICCQSQALEEQLHKSAASHRALQELADKGLTLLRARSVEHPSGVPPDRSFQVLPGVSRLLTVTIVGSLLHTSDFLSTRQTIYHR